MVALYTAGQRLRVSFRLRTKNMITDASNYHRFAAQIIFNSASPFRILYLIDYDTATGAIADDPGWVVSATFTVPSGFTGVEFTSGITQVGTPLQSCTVDIAQVTVDLL